MEKKGLNKVDLIFEKIDPKEVLTKAFKLKMTRLFNRYLIQVLKEEAAQVSLQD